MRGRLSLICAGLLVAGGCDKGAAAQETIADPAPVVVALPASAAGGACQLLDYPTVEEHTGLRFDVSGASRSGATRTCVLRSEEETHPDLTLAVSPTRADPAIFHSEAVPDGARRVTGLGRAAYRLTLAPKGSRGPVAEVGWLTTDGRMISLRCTLLRDQDRVAADEVATGLLDLAGKLDTAKG